MYTYIYVHRVVVLNIWLRVVIKELQPSCARRSNFLHIELPSKQTLTNKEERMHLFLLSTGRVPSNLQQVYIELILRLDVQLLSLKKKLFEKFEGKRGRIQYNLILLAMFGKERTIQMKTLGVQRKMQRRRLLMEIYSWLAKTQPATT